MAEEVKKEKKKTPEKKVPIQEVDDLMDAITLDYIEEIKYRDWYRELIDIDVIWLDETET